MTGRPGHDPRGGGAVGGSREGPPNRRSRGQSAVLGLVLLIGIVAVSSVAILTLADDTASSTQQRVEADHAEGAFVDFSQRMATASDDDVTRSTALAVGEDDTVAATDDGWIRFDSTALDEPINLSTGAVVYESDDGTVVAYQAGAVFRGTGAESRVVSAPPIEYDPDTRSFAFPVTAVSDDRPLGDGDVALAHNSTRTYREIGVLEGEGLEITIRSDYYRGWASYFRTQAGDAAVRDVDPENRTVTVRLGHEGLETAFDAGVIHAEDGLDDFCSSDCIVGNDSDERDMKPIDDEVEAIIEAARNDGTGTREDSMDVDEDLGVVDEPYTGDDQLSDGTYYAERVDETGQLEFDLSEGNATLVVEGTIDAGEAGIVVSEWEAGHTLKIYVGGDLYAHGDGDVCVDPCDENTSARVIRVFGTSTMGVDFGTGGTPRFEGTLYAASDEDTWGDRAGQCDDDVQVCIQSNPSIYGSIVAATVDVHSSAAELEYDESLGVAAVDLYPKAYTPPPQVTYVNVAHHEIDVEKG